MGESVRSLILGSHVIFYRQSDTEIVIIRVMHQSADTRHLRF